MEQGIRRTTRNERGLPLQTWFDGIDVRLRQVHAPTQLPVSEKEGPAVVRRRRRGEVGLRGRAALSIGARLAPY